MNRILSNINTKENKEKIFEKSASSKKKIIISMMIAIYCLITIIPLYLSFTITILLLNKLYHLFINKKSHKFTFLKLFDF